MATAIEHELSDDAVRTEIPAASPAAPQPIPAAANTNTRTHILGVDGMDFVRANRIHVKDGSLFIDPYLVIHPRELEPANEAELRKKLQLTFSINNPSFYESPDRTAIALNLGQLLPVSMTARRSKLMEEVKQFNTQVDTGVDTDLTRENKDKRNPFAAIVRETVEHPAVDPVGLEVLKNGLAMHLLLREKLTQQGFLNSVSDYVLRRNTSDQVLSDLADKIGASPIQVREAALHGGLDGVGKLLGLDPRYVANVKALADYAATQDFGYNLIEHWHLGRQLLGLDAPLQQKIITGLDARITAKMDEYRIRAHRQYDVPAPIQKEETRIAQALMLVEPIQRALMYKLGYEIAYSPEVTADDIAFHKGIYGLHRKAANNLSDIRGTYRIYFSGKGDLKGSMRTLVHEIAHNLWPEQFSAQEIAQIDQYAASDQERFGRFKRLLDEKFPEFERFLKAYQAGNDREKQAIAASAKEYFKSYGVSIDEGLLPYLRDAHDFQYLVQHAVDTLSVEGVRYSRSGYDGVPERFREVIARFAELKQVEYRAEPQLLHYLAPGLDQIFEAHYLPHLARVYKGILTAENPAHQAMQQAHQKNVEFIAGNNNPAPEGEQNPKVKEQPTEHPKVKEHIAMPIAANDPVNTRIAACMADDTPDSAEMPLNQISTASIMRSNSITGAANDAIERITGRTA